MKTSELTEVTSAQGVDLIELSVWNGSTYDSRKIEVSNLFKGSQLILKTEDLTNSGANDLSDLTVIHESAWDDYRIISIEVHGLTHDATGRIGMGLRESSGNTTLLPWVNNINLSGRILSPFSPSDDLATDGFVSFGMSFYRIPGVESSNDAFIVHADFAGGKEQNNQSMLFDNSRVNRIWTYDASWTTQNPTTTSSLWTHDGSGFYGYQIMTENGNFDGGTVIVRGTKL